MSLVKPKFGYPWPAILLLGICPGNVSAPAPKKARVCMLVAVLFIVKKNRKLPRCPSVDGCGLVTLWTDIQQPEEVKNVEKTLQTVE